MVKIPLVRGPERIIFFTRYPQAGKVKTRLIPALGPAGACDLHRRLTESALAQVRRLSLIRPVFIEVCFEGDSSKAMQEWLGMDLYYSVQNSGDLGARMDRAFQRAFQEGYRAVVLIGSDCPSRSAAILHQAFAALEDHDLVLGPALDGGYHLIGLKKQHPLFDQIPWGSSEVFTRTLQKSEDLGLKTFLLEPLPDIDRPEDLHFWESLNTAAAATEPELSIIIPALNEAKVLPLTLARIPQGSVFEVIIVDGGSHDQTVELSLSWGAKVISSPRGRAVQMNTGAGQARGRSLLFLHADTLLPWGFKEHIDRILSDPETVGGAFQLKLAPPLHGLVLIEKMANWRARVLQLPYGDQAIFTRSHLFRVLGGFKDIPIMEDVDLVQRLKRQGRIRIAPVPAITSSRRWKEKGVWRTTLKNQLTLWAFLAGITPVRLARWYHGEKIR
jgi:rSAM/selenodomain-associated transferase 2/rSAM/selenodomain-associated transferase 1